MHVEDLRVRARLSAFAQTIALVAAAVVLACPLSARSQPSAGTAAPDFALKDLAGRNLRLSEYRGDVVVLSFWASWCGPCRDSLLELDRLDARHSGAPVLLGVNLEGDAARAASVATSLRLGFPTLLDADQAVGRLYDAGNLPYVLVIDREGVVRAAWQGELPPAAELADLLEEMQP